MKILKLTTVFILSLAFFACEDDLEMPTLTYTPDKVILSDTVRCLVGENITFTPTGNADYVSFWSGETMKNYYGVKETTVTKASFSFVSGLYKDASVTSIKYEFKVLLSTDYTAPHTNVRTAKAAVAAATWRDITDQFANNATTSTTAGVPSGSFDVLEYIKVPFYIAFKYKNDTIAKGPTAYIKSFTVADSTKEFGLTTNLIAPVTTLVTGIGNTSWYSLLMAGSTTQWKSSGGMIQVAGASNDSNETWLISPIINLNRGTANMGVAIKDITILPRAYTYSYATKGVYKAVFVYTNSYMGVSQQSTQTFIIKVD
jgi:hypothetical protein